MSFGPLERRAVASVATQFFLNGATFASFVPRLPEIRDRIDVSTDVLGALMTGAGVIGLAGSALSARLLSKLGTRTTLIAGAAILIAALPAIGFARTPLVFMVALGILAAFDVIVDVAMNLQGSWLSARRHAPIMNRLHGLWSLGTVIGGVVSAYLTSQGVSLQAHLLGVAALLMLALVFVGRGLLREDEPAAEAPDAAGTTKTRVRMPLIVLALAGAFAIIVEIVSSDWAAFRLRDDFDTSKAFAGLGFVAFTSGMTTARFAGDWILQRLGSQRLTQLSVATAAIGLTGAAFTPNRYAVMFYYFLAGTGIATFFPKLYDDAAQLPGRRGAGLAALTAGSRIAGLGAPLAIGAMAATSLSVGTATGLIVIPSVIAFGLLTWASRTT